MSFWVYNGQGEWQQVAGAPPVSIAADQTLTGITSYSPPTGDTWDDYTWLLVTVGTGPNQISQTQRIPIRSLSTKIEGIYYLLGSNGILYDIDPAGGGRRQLLTGLPTPGARGGSGSFVLNGVIHYMRQSSSTQYQILTLDLTTGLTTSIWTGTLGTPSGRIIGSGWTASRDGNVYGVVESGDNNTYRLYTLTFSGNTPTFTARGPRRTLRGSGVYMALAERSGSLYLVSSNGSTMYVDEISRTDGSILNSFAGITAPASGRAIGAEEHLGDLLIWSGRYLLRMNLFDGTFTVAGSDIGSTNQGGTLFKTSGGNFFRVSNEYLLIRTGDSIEITPLRPNLRLHDLLALE